MDYIYTPKEITPSMLHGFFVGWPNPPSPEKHLVLLINSHKVVLAIDENKVVGFITAISDGVLAAYIPFLEVLPEYQNQGIGKELVKRMITELNGIYMIDLLCDKELQPYYEKVGLHKATGMLLRNYQSQGGL
ncbi:MAG: GNAT family N-acetyltransferase [Bacillus sp. (in: Bacteria)]|nr:GNAT family N-acetyltransferase [Bacillus sp. (in: firmicutes)]